MNRQPLKALLSLLLVLGLGTMASTAYASCKDIDTNPTWNAKLKEVQSAYKAGEYQMAINIAQSMASICADSPALNYYIATSYSAINEPTKASFYYERATNKLGEFRVSNETAKQIWYGRYEAEYPELTQNNIDRLKAENQRLSKENLRLSNEKHQSEQTQTISNTIDYTYEKHKASVILWTGVGLAIGGVALTGAGIGLMMDQKKELKHKDVTQTLQDGTQVKTDFELNNRDTYIAGVSILGVGGALTFAGVLMSGIGGYYYNHIKMNNTTALSFDVSPNSIDIQLTF